MSIRGFDKRSVMVRGVVGLCCVLLVSGNAMLVAQAPANQAPATQTPAPATTAKPAAPGRSRHRDRRQAHRRPARLAGGANRALSRPAAVPGARGLDLPARARPGAAVAREEPTLKGDALTAAVEKQPWDPSVQATVVVPDLLKRLTEDITWTHNLGNAFLEQQADVMDAVQRLRAKAKAAGKLDTTEQQKVETKVVETKTVIEIQPTSTQVVYVPTYSPTVIWGPPLYYPYPRSTTRRTRRARPGSGSAWESQWASGSAGAGATGAAGAAAETTSTSTTTTTSSATTTSIPATSTPATSTAATATGITTRATAAARPIRTRRTAEQVRRQHARQRGGHARASGAGDRAESRRRRERAEPPIAAARAATSASRPSGGGGDRVGSRSVPQTSTRSGSSAFSGASGGSYGASRASGSSSRGASSMGSRGGGGGGRRR